ncbi:MAG: hypothetical protein WC413_00995 [Candidatus Nanoarchaeia archaeon]
MNTISTIKKALMFFVMIFLVPLAFALQGDCDGNELIEIPDMVCLNTLMVDFQDNSYIDNPEICFNSSCLSMDINRDYHYDLKDMALLKSGLVNYVLGDCDGNGLIEVPDYSCLINLIVQSQNNTQDNNDQNMDLMIQVIPEDTETQGFVCSPISDCSNMDMNGDGIFDYKDVGMLKSVLGNYLIGDCDNNKLIEVPDVTCLTRLLSKQNTICSPVADCSNMDIDFDGNFTQEDLNELISRLGFNMVINNTLENNIELENQIEPINEIKYNSTACKELDMDNDSFINKSEANTALEFIRNAITNGLSLDQVKFDLDGNGIIEIPDLSAITSILSKLPTEESTMNISSCGFVAEIVNITEPVIPAIVSSSSSGGSGGSSHRHTLTRIVEVKPIVYPTTEVQEPILVQDVKEVTDVISQTDNKFMGFAKKLVYEFIGAIILIAIILGIYLWKRN